MCFRAFVARCLEALFAEGQKEILCLWVFRVNSEGYASTYFMALRDLNYFHDRARCLRFAAMYMRPYAGYCPHSSIIRVNSWQWSLDETMGAANWGVADSFKSAVNNALAVGEL